MVPGVALAAKSVLVIDRSAIRARVSTSVAELLPGVGSVTPAGGVTEAVLTRLAVVEASSVPVIVNVAVAPTVSETGTLTFPVPDAGHEPEPLIEQAHDTALIDAGSASATVAPTTADGPALETTTV